MPEVYEITKVLEEVIEDEKVGISKHKKISQQEIKQILRERRKAPGNVKDTSALPLGQALVQGGMITGEQLETALKLQADTKGKIGSILVELGYISDEDLLKYLAKQLDIESRNLLDIDIANNVMSLVPSRVMLKYRVLPFKDEGRSIYLAMENPGDLTAIREIEFLTGKRVIPVVVPSYQMDLAIKQMEGKGGAFLSGADIRLSIKGSSTSLESLLKLLLDSKGSDLLITAGAPPTIKKGAALTRVEMPPVSADQCVAYAKAIMAEGQWEDFLRNKEIDFAISLDGVAGRFRVSAYRQKNTVSLAIRRISETIPTFEQLGLPGWLEDFALKTQGLILITSPSGHGKTTTMASMIDLINKKRKANIITLEDPIEYVYKPQLSNINQREIGADTSSFSEGLRRIFRQLPDAIVVGEMRDHETFGVALNAASTGHLVLSTMQTGNTTAAIDSMVNRFPHHLQTQIRQQLADVLLVVFSQRLMPRKEAEGVVIAYEKLVNTHRIKNYIRENRVCEIRTQIQLESDDFSSIDASLINLLKEGTITLESALPFAENPEYFEASAKLTNPVIPAKAGIQEVLKESGFPPSRE